MTCSIQTCGLNGTLITVYGAATASLSILTTTALHHHIFPIRDQYARLLPYITILLVGASIVEKLCLDVHIVKILQAAQYAEKIYFGILMEPINILRMSKMSISNEERNVCSTLALVVIARTIRQGLVN